MENNSSQKIKRKNLLQKYHALSSPLVSLTTAKQNKQAAQEVRLNASMRLDSIKNRTKVYALDQQSTN